MLRILFLHSLFITCVVSNRLIIPNVPVYESSEYMIFQADNPFLKDLLSDQYAQSQFRYRNLPGEKFLVVMRSAFYHTSYRVVQTLGKRIPVPYVLWDFGYHSRFANEQITIESIKQGYKDIHLNERLLKQIARDFPRYAEYHTLGNTAQGRVIPALELRSTNVKKAKTSLLFTGAHHGNELLPTENVYDIIYMMLHDTRFTDQILLHADIWFVPIVNPDGSAFFWFKDIRGGRKNGSVYPGQKADSPEMGVDLNRNYPFRWNSGVKKASSPYTRSQVYRGPMAGSEPEVRALVSLAGKKHFAGAISFHSQAGAILVPYTAADAKNVSPSHLFTLAQSMATEMESHHPTRKYHPRKNLYPVDGTDQDYYHNTYGTVAFIIENSHHNIAYEGAQKVTENFRSAMKLFMTRILHGPAIRLLIQNERGKPLGARVKIREIHYFENEKFFAQPVTGRFFLSVPASDKYTVDIDHPGFSRNTGILQNLEDTRYTTIVMHSN